MTPDWTVAPRAKPRAEEKRPLGKGSVQLLLPRMPRHRGAANGSLARHQRASTWERAFRRSRT